MMRPSPVHDADAVARRRRTRCPSSAPVSLHGRDAGPARFSATVGSGWWLGKVPSLSVKRPVASTPSAREQLRRHERRRAVPAVVHHADRRGPSGPMRADDVVDVAVDHRHGPHACRCPRAERRPRGGSRARTGAGSPRRAAKPVPTQILKPLYSGGLCEPVIWMPPTTASWCSAPVEQRRRHDADVHHVATGRPSARAPAHRAARRRSADCRAPPPPRPRSRARRAAPRSRGRWPRRPPRRGPGRRCRECRTAEDRGADAHAGEIQDAERAAVRAGGERERLSGRRAVPDGLDRQTCSTTGASRKAAAAAPAAQRASGRPRSTRSSDDASRP